MRSLERFQNLLLHFEYCPPKPRITILVVTNGLIWSGTSFKSSSNLTRWDTNMLGKPLRHFRKWSRQPHHAAALLWWVNPSCVAAFLIVHQGPQETGDRLVQLPSPETNQQPKVLLSWRAEPLFTEFKFHLTKKTHFKIDFLSKHTWVL